MSILIKRYAELNPVPILPAQKIVSYFTRSVPNRGTYTSEQRRIIFVYRPAATNVTLSLKPKSIPRFPPYDVTISAEVTDGARWFRYGNGPSGDVQLSTFEAAAGV